MAMAGSEEKQRADLIRTSLINFICSNTNNTQSNQVQIINETLDDEIIINYVVTVLEDSLDEDFQEIDEFCEMLAAYFPQFIENIPQNSVLQWIQQLLNTLKNFNKKEGESTSSFESKLINILDDTSSSTSTRQRTISNTSFEDHHNNSRSRTTSWSSSGSSGSNGSIENASIISQVSVILEMFPNISKADVITVLSLANGDIEKAVQIILLDDHKLNKISNGVSPKLLGNSPKLDEKTLKKRLVERYGFIDKAQDAKEFKPILPKEEPKKLVRYREGQVVSTKGERYTEVAVNKDGEETKIRTYICKTQKQLQMQNP